MSLSLNQVTIAGNLTADPELRPMTSSTLALFCIAVNRKFKSGDTLKEETAFIDVESWGKTAELVNKYCRKGDPVFIEGRLKMDKWKTKDGSPRQTLKVVADNVQFLRPAGQREQPQPAPKPAAPEPDFDDDVPL